MSKDTRFQPGQSGNPGGRPKGAVSITSRIKRILRENEDKADELATALIDLAIAGNPAAMREVMGRHDGPLATNINVSQLSTEQLLAALEVVAGEGGEEEGDIV